MTVRIDMTFTVFPSLPAALFGEEVAVDAVGLAEERAPDEPAAVDSESVADGAVDIGVAGLGVMESVPVSPDTVPRVMAPCGRAVAKEPPT
eukprot:7810624-Alexandrium_andersonii.AAC.1